MPDEIWDKYLENPRNFVLLWQYGAYKAKKEKEEIEKQEAKAKKSK